MTDTHHGGCHCGTIRDEISAGPVVKAYCCCDACKGTTGAPVVSLVAAPERSFAITKGTQVRYESFPNVFRGFRGACGMSPTYRNAGYPDRRFEEDAPVAVTTPSLDNIETFPPTGVFHDDELPDWLPAEQLCPNATRHHPKATTP